MLECLQTPIIVSCLLTIILDLLAILINLLLIWQRWCWYCPLRIHVFEVEDSI